MFNYAKVFFILIGAAIIRFLGGVDTMLIALCVFMAIDFITGLIVAGVFKSSGKSESGALDSRASLKGLFKKICIFLAVIVAVQLDLLMQTEIIRSGAILAFCASEVLSIVENMGLMGIKMPAALVNAIEALKNKTGDKP